MGMPGKTFRIFRRRLAISLRLTSLAICMLAVPMWARSCAVTDAITSSMRHDEQLLLRTFDLWSGNGVLHFGIRTERLDAREAFELVLHDRQDQFGLRYRAIDPYRLYLKRMGRMSDVQIVLDDWGFGARRDESERHRLLTLQPTTRPIGSMSRSSVAVWVPWWFVFLASAIAPGWWLKETISRRRRGAPGCCAVCGYDLRATPGRCPECGQSVPESPGAPQQ